MSVKNLQLKEQAEKWKQYKDALKQKLQQATKSESF